VLADFSAFCFNAVTFCCASVMEAFSWHFALVPDAERKTRPEHYVPAASSIGGQAHLARRVARRVPAVRAYWLSAAIVVGSSSPVSGKLRDCWKWRSA
jgi:hypothetical protein